MKHGHIGTHMESAPQCSDGCSTSLQGVDGVGATASTHGMHNVQDWLASDHAAWSSMLPLYPATTYGTSAAANTKDRCDEGLDASTTGQSGWQPTVPEPAAGQHDADAPTQHASQEAAEQQSAVAALVQRFERFTVAKVDTQKRNLARGISALAFDQILRDPQRAQTAKQMGLVVERAAGVAGFCDAKDISSAGDDARPSRQIQPSCGDATLHRTPADVCSDNGSQPVAWHVNASFQPESSSLELGVADGLSHTHAEPAARGTLAKLRAADAAGADPASAWAESCEEDGWLPHRYAWAVHQSHCLCASTCVQGRLSCHMCREGQRAKQACRLDADLWRLLFITLLAICRQCELAVDTGGLEWTAKQILPSAVCQA